jgi:hypothetical protein
MIFKWNAYFYIKIRHGPAPEFPLGKQAQHYLILSPTRFDFVLVTLVPCLFGLKVPQF